MIHLDFETTRLFEYMPKIILPAVSATVRMLLFSMILGLIIGTLVAIVLVLTSPHGLKPNPRVYKVLGFIVNMIRAFPVIILIVAISPLTRAIVGTSIGEKAAIVPLTLSAFPVIARYIEASILEVDPNLILAARSFGASDRQIIFRVLFPEAMHSIVSGLTTTSILFLGATTLAGAVGAGGLGAVALTYGYQWFDDVMMYAIVLILFVMVLVIQGGGEFIYRKQKEKGGTFK
ncbi:MAG: ABC transporter permease [Desulfobulbaceae bacterium]|uniref:D-methionine transport system permease protein n=2 Tax=Desulfofustis glycolicus TaxID=51195 RepID=A0A1M5YQM3_9BACT|nr:methionine ABC transporter permease [Desulfofustis glycolicus]MCB2215832.1 ABC transporter permease [Desulfobulbaceae bacterium]SHI14366.1 D-methionine transport system permease protein [Desulfofustis glycolicus DSM 9705]